MLHAVHSAGATRAPVVIYRGRGIYAWAGEESQLNNWPMEDDCTRSNGLPGRLVVGADPAAASSCQPHNFHTPTYPRGLDDCAACHVDGFVDLLPDPTAAMASTVETGDELGDPLDDVLEGVTASSCMTCHRSGVPGEEAALKRHAYDNGWVPQAFPEGRQSIIDSNQ
ncbi:MAG: hypothetical protein AMS21_13555 [Gemmatimonas sp. SG8_38_2]|nr:MAG: hypothetical protein AMS21_13555 [Gemmatimonas sp. SG8_38_2]